MYESWRLKLSGRTSWYKYNKLNTSKYNILYLGNKRLFMRPCSLLLFVTETRKMVYKGNQINFFQFINISIGII